MYEFLVTATDQNGKTTTRVVTAENSQAVIALLEAEGCTEIILHTDDAGAVSTDVKQDDLEGVSAEDMVAFREKSAFGMFLYLLNKGYYKTRVVSFLSTIYVAYRLHHNSPHGFWFYAAVMTLVLPIVVAFHLAFLSVSRQYEMLIENWAWGRWDDVLELEPTLRGKIPDLELDARTAVALANTGRYDEGLETITAYENDSSTPRWMYLARLSEFYYCAGEIDNALETSQQAYAEAPDNPTVEFDYALLLLKLQTRLAEASRLMESVESKRLSDMLKMFLPFARGLSALNDGNYSNAREHLLEAREQLQPFAAQPLIRQILDFNSAYLAIASANCGEPIEAVKHYQRAKKRLEAFGDDLLLDRLETAMEKYTAVGAFQS
ncbi:MAG: hypothetical protein ACE37I_16440 [Rubinisphaera brasiliensis]|uniref:hypothetical protein n=1 Tax=Rubinisphaera brasiliensis TaxID=119 RepID=UPI00391C1982